MKSSLENEESYRFATNSMILAQKQTHRSMEQNREVSNKAMLIQLTNHWQRRQEYTMGKRQSL